MKVNITYSIDLEKVSKEIRNRLREYHSNFKEIGDDVAIMCQCLERNEVNKALELISEFRDLLAEYDNQLSEYGVILAQCQQATAELYLAKEESSRQTKDLPSQVVKAANENESSKLISNKSLKADIAESKYLDPEDPTPDLLFDDIRPEHLVTDDYVGDK